MLAIEEASTSSAWKVFDRVLFPQVDEQGGHRRGERQRRGERSLFSLVDVVSEGIDVQVRLPLVENVVPGPVQLVFETVHRSSLRPNDAAPRLRNRRAGQAESRDFVQASLAVVRGA